MRIAAFSAIVGGAIADPHVWSADCARYRINDQDGVVARFGLMTSATDPRWVNAVCDGTLETQGPTVEVTPSMSAVSEAGILGPDSAMRFGKVADPDNAAKKCYLMRLRQGDGSNHRTELSFSPNVAPVPRAAVAWIGLAVRIPESWRSMTGTDEVAVWQIHETPDAGDDTQQAPICMAVRGSRQYIWVRGNSNATTLASTTTHTEVFSEATWPGDAWQFFAIKVKSDWDAAAGPRLEVWRRIGTSAKSAKVVDYAGPNSYNNTARDYVKSGLYYYAQQWTGSGGLIDKVMHHKGIYQWLDGQGIDQEAILDHLQSI